MASQLMNILTFAAVGGGATVVQAHGIQVNGVAKIPDLLGVDAAGFTVTADATNVTVTNNTAGPITVHVWAEFKHSILREFGNPQIQQLTPAPFVFNTGSSGGGSGSAVSFQYTVIGTEPDLQNLVIPLPAARASVNYGVQVELGTFTNMLTHAVPDGTKALNQFVLALSGNASAGDTFQFAVQDY